jgi:hypothetical protein
MATPVYDPVFLYNYTLAQICSIHRSSIHHGHPFVPNWLTLKGQSTYISPSTATADLELQGNRPDSDLTDYGPNVLSSPIYNRSQEPLVHS